METDFKSLKFVEGRDQGQTFSILKVASLGMQQIQNEREYNLVTSMEKGTTEQ